MMLPSTDPVTLALILSGLAMIGLGLRPVLRKRRIETLLRRRLMHPSNRVIKDSRIGQDQISVLSIRLPDRDQIVPLVLMALLSLLLVHLDPIKNWSLVLKSLIVFSALYLGYRFPHMRQERALKSHRAAIERDLPAMIDLLVIMLDSGSTFDQAIARIIEDHRIPAMAIKTEFAKLHAELSVTPERQLAFRKFASSVALNDLRLLASVLVQSENFGTPISKGLRSLAYEIRERHYHQLEARGSALGPKLAVPMALFFLPLIFIVVLAPTVIRALHLS